MYDRNKAHYTVSTAILVNKEGKFLIARRAEYEKVFPGKWTVPGGKLEVLDYVLKKKNTSEHWYNVVENSLIREVMEEVGVSVKTFGYVTSMVYLRPDGIPCLILSLYSHVEDSKIQLNEELTEFAWVTLEESKDYDLIDGIYGELEMLDKKLKGEKVGLWKK